MSFWRWSRTAASNGTADPSINYAEGMSPSGLNDSGRAVMAAAAKYRDDIAGAIVTGGTSTAYTVASNQVFDSLAHLDGAMIAFTPHTTNGATVTLNVDGLGGKPLRSSPGIDLPSGAIIQGTPYTATYNNSDGAFYLHGFVSSPYSIPIGGMIDFTGTVAPSSCFVLPFGQAISRTVYAAYFAMVGTTYGTGDGSTTFNVIDARGRVVAGKDDMGGSAASRLTSTSITSGGPTTLGGSGGADTKTLATANLPPYTPAGSISNGAITFGNAVISSIVNGSPNAISVSSTGTGANITPALNPSQATSTFTGTAQGGTSTAFSLAQPTIIANKLLRII